MRTLPALLWLAPPAWASHDWESFLLLVVGGVAVLLCAAAVGVAVMVKSAGALRGGKPGQPQTSLALLGIAFGAAVFGASAWAVHRIGCEMNAASFLCGSQPPVLPPYPPAEVLSQVKGLKTLGDERLAPELAAKALAALVVAPAWEKCDGVGDLAYARLIGADGTELGGLQINGERRVSITWGDDRHCGSLKADSRAIMDALMGRAGTPAKPRR